MNVERDLHMACGNGENSYATNSRIQEKAIQQARPVLQKAIEQLYTSLSPRSTMVVADLGCSSGPNTLLVVAEVISMIADYSKKAEDDRLVEVQFFLNDLPGNDFNHIFQSLEKFNKLAAKEAENEAPPPPYYVAGLPGSLYTRLFPGRSVHLFHSSYCLMWRSKVPEELSKGTYPNEGNIYIGKTTPPAVVKLYREQFQKDFALLLTWRSKELVSGGRMVLTFLGRKSQEMLLHGEVGGMWELLAQALQSLVLKGRVEEEKLTSFHLPYYAPSVDEVKEVVEENSLFDIEHTGLFELNWDPFDDSDSDVALNCARGGADFAKCIRAVMEPLIAGHFGDAILDDLFVVYASMVAKYLEKAKAKAPVIVVSLKAKH